MAVVGPIRVDGPAAAASPSEVLRTAVDVAMHGYQQTSLWEHTATSVARAGVAFAAAIVIGVPLGLLMGMSPALSAVLDPFVQFLRPLPKIALIPLTVVWFGIGEGSKFFLIFIASFLSILVGAAAAVGGVSAARLRAPRCWARAARRCSATSCCRIPCRNCSPACGCRWASAGPR
ncbi:hypothetical protein WJ977_24330 [Achromobacter xylosoxidans]